jgi:hypothetical protein
MTLVGYFNSLRELGGMRRLVEDDVQSRALSAVRGEPGRLILEELTSRKSASDIPAVLDQLGAQRTSQAKRTASRGKDSRGPVDRRSAGDQHDLRRSRRAAAGGDGRRGPAQEHERVHPGDQPRRPHLSGLVFAVYNWARPRDLSHYETFGHYHRTLYRQVEALSVTPFAPRAGRPRLTGVLASLLRLCGTDYNDNAGARRVDPVASRSASPRRDPRPGG